LADAVNGFGILAAGKMEENEGKKEKMFHDLMLMRVDEVDNVDEG
jgi:hypothetical protein